MERRKINFTDEERTILMDLMERHRDVLECKWSDAVSINAKKKTWEKLADEFNSRHNVRPRTSKQLKKCWDNLKEMWRRAKAEDTRKIFKTGGGAPAGRHMNDELLRVGEVATDMATRLVNPFDSDCSGPGTEPTPAVAALLASSQPGRSTDADDADMEYDDSWQWDIENQDEAAASQCAAPPDAETAQLVPEPASPLATCPPAPAPPAAVPPVPTARRRINASRSSCTRDDAVDKGRQLPNI
ncbi:myb-related transcription factor, partner of profilin-like [Dermacentor albipictus]|uniref:myb-related transcription factor, partner of profilin-like n=1 Tax=Dermacentor albipictus TaxID=60249 RepID=UPI0031FD9700